MRRLARRRAAGGWGRREQVLTPVSRPHFPRPPPPRRQVLLVGDTAVGKSCLLMRFTADKFEEETASTIGARHAPPTRPPARRSLQRAAQPCAALWGGRVQWG